MGTACPDWSCNSSQNKDFASFEIYLKAFALFELWINLLQQSNIPMHAKTLKGGIIVETELKTSDS